MELKPILKQPYSRDSYLSIIKHLSSGGFSENQQSATHLLWANSKINEAIQLGSFYLEWEEISVWEIRHNSSADPRVTVTKETLKIMGRVSHNYALVSYISNDTEKHQWRLSLITKGYIEWEERISSPRRFSFLLGEWERIKTPCDKLKDPFTTIKNLTDAFDVEVVRKEFFKQYLNLFLELYKELKVYEKTIDNKNDIVNLTKNLMGKIVFLYFIQKKWRLGVHPEKDRWHGRKDFMRFLWEDYKWDRTLHKWEKINSFYNDYLEPLFYEALSNPRESHVYERFGVKIPYLNWGLFEKEYEREKSTINPDDEVFEKIIEIFDRYNFTIHEDDPFDREVAVDPEMLGKIFETMISVSKDNIEDILSLYQKEKDKSHDSDKIISVDIWTQLNRDFGAFYTPPEIVHYMAKESLIYYLINGIKQKRQKDEAKQIESIVRALFTFKEKHLHKDEIKAQANIALDRLQFDLLEPYVILVNELLKNIKVLDPAVGSWAFPMGILHEISGLRRYLIDNFDLKKESDYEIKKTIIQDSIYGVDIEPGAVDIARLRFRLSLVIDTKIPEPLPNLNFKFVCADSLTPLGNEKWLYDNLNLETFKKYKREFFTAQWEDKKIKENRIRKFLQSKETNIFASEWQRKLASRKPFDKSNTALFFDSDLMLWENGFDLVIGNPPYIQLQKNSGHLANLYENVGYKSFARTGDIYCLFYERAFQLLKEWWLCTYITSNKWMRAWYWEKLRDFFVKYTNPLELIDLWPDVFETATVDSNILIWQKKKVSEFHMKWLDLVKEKNIKSIEIYHNQFVNIDDITNDSWIIISSIQKNIKIKMEKMGKILKEWDIQINYGIKTAFNDAFIINETTKKDIIKDDPKSSKIIKPVLRWKDILKYGYKFAGLYLINTHNWVKWKITRIDCPKEYPGVFNYLKTFLPEIEARQDQWDHWSNLRNCAYIEEFEKEKIIYSEISQSPCFCYDNNGFYIWNTWYILTWKSIKYLTALLNSKLVSFWFKNFYSTNMWSSWYRYLAQYMENLPIPQISEKDQKPFVDIVDQILAKKKQNPNVDTTKFEEQIDQMVYKLYWLTDEEIKTIEENTK